LITKTGWTLDYINTSLTLPEAEELLDYWAEQSPGRPKKPKPQDKEAQLAELMTLFQGGILRG